MRNTFLTAAVFAVFMAGAVMAAPSTFEPGRGAATPSPKKSSTAMCNMPCCKSQRPYSLTGDLAPSQRKLVWRDVPTGRGQSQRLPFYVPADAD